MRTAAVILSAIGIILYAGCKKPPAPNSAPNTPAVPSGPTSCAVGVEYTFSSSATDPDGDSVSIRFDWGDGDTSDWSPYVPSGDTISVDHSWSSPGTHAVASQTRDRDSIAPTWSGDHTLAVYLEWEKTYGTSLPNCMGEDVQQTSDGGYIVAGNAFNDSGLIIPDGLLIRVDAYGDTVWTRVFGGAGGDDAHSVQLTLDGGYIICGYTGSYSIGNDVWLASFDVGGSNVWNRMVGEDTSDDGASSIRTTRDGGYIIAGTTYSFGAGYSDVYLVKTDAGGDTVWTRTYGGTGYDGGNYAEQTSDGGYIITGYTRSFGAGHDDAWLIKTDALGNEVWTRTFGGGGGDDGRCVRQTLDGGYIIAGTTESYGAGSSDVWLIKTNANGETGWSRTFGGNSSDWGYCVQQAQDGGYIVAGTTQSFGAGSIDAWLVKTNAQGDTAWTRTYGGTSHDQGLSVRQTDDGGYIVVGRNSSYNGSDRAWLIKTGPNGEMDADGGK